MGSEIRDDAEAASAAFSRLSDKQRTLVGRCLSAIVEGPYIPDWEFRIIMGVTREETASVAAAWPDPAGTRFVFVAVSNTLNNLLGYPHERWPQLEEFIGAERSEVIAALASWRGASGQSFGYVDAME